MNKNASNILNKINNKIDLEQNLSIYSTELLTDYYEYAMVGLTMNYYVLYEVLCEEEAYIKKDVKDTIKQLNDLIYSGIIAPFDGTVREKALVDIEALRKTVTNKMDVIVDYVEKMLINEYILNRVEYRFDNSESEIGDKIINDDDISREIFRYIFSVQDNMIINDKIKLIIGQLPIRMAKSKFYDLISNSISLYKDSDVSSVESFLYTIRSSSTLYKPKSDGKYFIDIKDVIDSIKNIDYANISEKEFDIAKEKLDDATEKLNAYSDIYCAVEDVINKVYAVLLATPYANGSSFSDEDNKNCIDIIAGINKRFLDESEEDIEDEITVKLEFTEGRQEHLYYRYSQFESELFGIYNDNDKLIESMMLAPQFECMKKCQLLLSSSSFAELDGDSNDEKTADNDYINNAKGRIISEISELFDNCSVQVRRAVMANVLNKIPVFFTNSNEIMQYIGNCLSSCKDDAEKRASIDLISSLIYSDDCDEISDFDSFDFDDVE